MDHLPLGENACVQEGDLVRSFIAVDLDAPLIPKIVDIQSAITEGTIKFVEPENLHFTLKFLGDITESKKDDIVVKLREICSSFKPFPLLLKGVGVFPSYSYVRVIWIGVESDEFFTLSRLVDSGMGRLGFRQEKDITPHLTIGRVKYPRNRDTLKSQVEAFADTVVGDMTVHSVILKKSELTRKGPIYTDVEDITL